MSFRQGSLVRLCLCILLEVSIPAFSQDSITANQVISNFLQALGGTEKITAINTLSEKGDATLERFGLHPGTGHWTFESYFKAPNLRTTVTFGSNGMAGAEGCDGKIAWSVSATGQRKELKPTPDRPYTCEDGLDLLPFLVTRPNLKIQLKGQKKVGDRMAWEIRADDPSSPAAQTFYFDVESHLLLRWHSYFSNVRTGTAVDQIYSDYRDVGGFVFPFTRVTRTDISVTTTRVGELTLNIPLENSRFQEPGTGGGGNESSPQEANVTPMPLPAKAVPPVTPASSATNAAALPQTTYVNAINYISCSIAELHHAIPELRGLRANEDQSDLNNLLHKVGTTTVELVREIPNLIADEQVVRVQQQDKSAAEKFSYLILAHRGTDAMNLDEFRVDFDTGLKFESDAPPSSAEQSEELGRASKQVSARSVGAPPLSQGYASLWVRFFPSNRSESDFRYLGEQKMEGRNTFVVAFAQKPRFVRMPGLVVLQGKSLPAYDQGVAWIDASNFTIVRLRSDLLEPIYDLSLTQLTAEVEFANTQAAGFAAPLWLPREVEVTSVVSGKTFEDRHHYSNYRSFQVHSRILLDR